MHLINLAAVTAFVTLSTACTTIVVQASLDEAPAESSTSVDESTSDDVEDGSSSSSIDGSSTSTGEIDETTTGEVLETSTGEIEETSTSSSTGDPGDSTSDDGTSTGEALPIEPTLELGTACSFDHECVSGLCRASEVPDAPKLCTLPCEPLELPCALLGLPGLCVEAQGDLFCAGTQDFGADLPDYAVIALGEQKAVSLDEQDLDLVVLNLGNPGVYSVTVTPAPGLDVAIKVYSPAGLSWGAVNSAGPGEAESFPLDSPTPIIFLGLSGTGDPAVVNVELLQ